MPVEPSKDDAQVRPFTDFLVDHHSGRTSREVSEALHDLVTAVRATGRKGNVTLKIIVDPLKGDTDTLLVTADVSVKMPTTERKAAVFFPDDEGNLRRDDPRQPHLPLKELTSEALDVASKLKEA